MLSQESGADEDGFDGVDGLTDVLDGLETNGRTRRGIRMRRNHGGDAWALTGVAVRVPQALECQGTNRDRMYLCKHANEMEKQVAKANTHGCSFRDFMFQFDV
jgi:hypothetical protein